MGFDRQSDILLQTPIIVEQLGSGQIVLYAQRVESRIQVQIFLAQFFVVGNEFVSLDFVKNIFVFDRSFDSVQIIDLHDQVGNYGSARHVLF